tara:strand:+ start:1069 stop:1230 length:162 start_codon:yes stop_codon:yes gene_type:complete
MFELKDQTTGEPLFETISITLVRASARRPPARHAAQLARACAAGVRRLPQERS